MPQVIPLESSETLVFTPECFADKSDAPSLVLGTPTPREKMRREGMLIEEGAKEHSFEDFRSAYLTGLRIHWKEQHYEKYAAYLTQYWEARDAYDVAKREDPDVLWDYDPFSESFAKETIEKIAEIHRPINRMKRQNFEYSQKLIIATIANVVRDVRGIDVDEHIDSDGLSFYGSMVLIDKLEAFAKRAGVEEPRLAGLQLFLACDQRFRLEEEEAKNSASPSLSSDTPVPSTGKAAAGKSRARASSKKTPVNA